MSIEGLTEAFKKSLTLENIPEVSSIDTCNSNNGANRRQICQSNDTLLSSFESKQPELTELQKAEQHQWLTLSTRFPDTIEQLNEGLKERTTLCNTEELTVADSVVFARILPLAKTWDVEKVKALRHIIRWADFVQNTLNVPQDDRIKVDVDLEAPREMKAKPEKKKKGGEQEQQSNKKESSETPVAAADAEGGKADEGKKQEKKKKEKKPQPPKEEVVVTPGMIDFRVGHIEKAVKHPDADSLYVSTINVGDEEGPRTICSGLVKYIPLEDMQDKMVVVVANLKPANMRGVKSNGMVLCASNNESVEIINPPADAKAGDKVFFEGYDLTPERQLNPKKKIWESMQPLFSTDDEYAVTFKKEGEETTARMVNKSGEVCKSSTMTHAKVS